MFRKFACALVMLALCVGTTLAKEIRAIITKVDNGKITFSENKMKFDKDTKKLEGEKGEERTLPVADNVKVTQMKFNKDTKKLEAGGPLENGLKNEKFTKIGKKGVSARVVTDGDNKKITEIRVFSFGKKDK